MAFSKKIKTLRGYYVSAHEKRMQFYSWKWRLFAVLLAVLIVLFVNDYLQAKYAPTVVYTLSPDGSISPASYTLADKLFNWFMTGVIFGIIALAILYEGEFLLGINKMIKAWEKQAGKNVQKTFSGISFANPKRKDVKPRKK